MAGTAQKVAAKRKQRKLAAGQRTWAASDGTSCEGTDGYSDIGRDTQVTVKNGKGEILATTSLRGMP